MEWIENESSWMTAFSSEVMHFTQLFIWPGEAMMPPHEKLIHSLPLSVECATILAFKA
jgi:hypothetical protein